MATRLRRRPLIALSVLLGVVILLGGGYIWTSQSSEAPRGRECDGVLAESEALAALGEESFEDEEGPGDYDRSRGSLRGAGRSLLVGCEVSGSASDGEIRASIRGVPFRGRTTDFDGLYPRLRGELPPAPLRNGWTGFFTVTESAGDGDGASEAHAITAVLLDCRERRSDLLVTVETESEDATVDHPTDRRALARTATATAKRADKHWKCGADLGGPLRTVPMPVNEDEDVPLAAAEGTCAGVPVRGQAISRGWESARGGLVERCVVGNDRPSPDYGYRLEALYGPYAEAVRADYRHGYEHLDEDPVPGKAPHGSLPDGGYWASATCPRDHESAFYSIAPDFDPENDVPGKDRRGDKKDRSYERAALAAFVERSAKAHGCSDVDLP